MKTALPALIDSSVFIAAARPRETRHEDAVAALQAHAADGLATPVTILTETMCFIGARLGVDQQRRFWDAFLSSGIRLVPVDDDLLALARDIDGRYGDAGFGFCDCTLLAACESLGVSRVLSLDRRLTAYRPTFATGVELAP